MRADQHLAKAKRIENTMMQKLDLNKDYEIFIWCCIHASNQLFNVALHKQGLTKDDVDQIHSNIPEYRGSRTAEIDRIIALMEKIEMLGPRYVRGCEPWDQKIGEECLQNFRLIKQVAVELCGP